MGTSNRLGAASCQWFNNTKIVIATMTSVMTCQVMYAAGNESSPSGMQKIASGNG